MSITPERWKEIEELYHASVDQAPEIRESLLEKTSSEVREIVQRLLSQEKTGILDRPAWEAETELLTPSPAIGPGSSLGPYCIEACVGTGGMGEVFRASDTRLARKVAIKAIRAGRSSEGLELRFLGEARAASALNHSNIITIYDVGTVEGQPYIVMEWIEGQTLREKLTQGPLSIMEVLGIASQILDALAAAHESGIIHRDLKPENIMVNASGRIKVLDFGIAKRISMPADPTLDFVSRNTLGFVVGTPGYMSPEQARGEPLDFRSDHFSFGAVLYELAAGRRAFAGNSIAEVQAAILLHQPEPLTSLNPHAPAPLQWVVERCLAKASRDRFETTEELRREFSAIVTRAGQLVAASPPINNIPTPRTALIGREAELSRLRDLVADPGLRILTLTGAGGIGKTRLAVELGRQVADQFAGGVCFVQLEKVSDASLVPSEVALALGVAQWPGADPEAAIANHLRQLAGPVLLVLDNFEHVLEAALFAARLASERLKAVVTSRAALRVYGEYEFAVPSLNSGYGTARQEMARSPAVRLFIERATGLRGSTIDEEQLGIVSAICTRLDGLPLAIELAAARTRLFPLKTLQTRLDDPLAVLVGGPRDLPQRQHTLRATIDWSYNLLDAEHRKLFRRMAVFVGGATVEAIEAVCDTRQDLKVNLWDAVEHLADNSLIRRIDFDDTEPRFALLETMREYGLEQLAAANEEHYTRKAHAAYCLVSAEEEAPAMRRERTGKHRFDADFGNFRAALDWLAMSGEVEWGLRLVMALGVYFFSRRLHTEEIHTANADRIADLFWAVRGGGGNFGIAVSLEFRLHPVTQLYAGPILYPLEQAAGVLRLFRDFMRNAPREVNAFFAFLIVPPGPPFPESLHGKTVCAIMCACTGDVGKAEAVTKPLREFGPPLLALPHAMPYPFLQSLFDGLLPPGLHHYWKADFVRELTDEAIAEHVKFGPRIPTVNSAVHIYAMDGAIQDVGAQETAFAYRDVRYVHIVAAVTPDPAALPLYREWAQHYWAALHPHSAGGAYVNFLMEEGEERIASSYIGNRERLATIKAKYDPLNIFRVNQNIQPAK